MSFRFYLNNQEYKPINIGELSVDINLITEAGAYYYEYAFRGSPIYEKQAYQFINAHSDGQKIEFRIDEVTDSGTYAIVNGKFTNRDCEDFKDSKKIQCEIDQDSLYKKLIENYDKTFNFLNTTQVVSSVYQRSNIYEYRLLPLGTNTPPVLPYYGTFVVDTNSNAPFFAIGLYVKETKTTYCIGGEPTPPAGTGWELEVDNCEGKSLATYARKAPFFDPVPLSVTFNSTNAIPPAVPAPPPITGANEDWYLMDNITNPSLSVSYWVDLNTLIEDEKDLNNGRELVDVINFGLNIDVQELDVQSDFLTNDINPTNAETPSTTKGIQLHSISDIKDPDADIPARVENTTLKTLLEDFVHDKLNCFWRVDERTKRLIIENFSDVFSPAIFDVSPYQLSRTYTYDNTDIPRAEEFPSSDSSVDFTGVPILYNNAVADGVKTYNTDAFYSEVESILDDPDSYPQDGIVSICRESTSPNQPLQENGAITGEYAPNAPMGMATLHEKFYPYYRPFRSGILNFNNMIFNTNKQVRVLSDDIITTPCSLFFFDPYSRFVGKGFTRGALQQANYSFLTKKLTITNLRYNE